MELQYDLTEEEWNTTGIPITSSHAWSWDLIEYICIHWPGGNRHWTTLQNFMNKTHLGYLARKTPSTPNGYSFGYSAAVDNDTGETAQGRGLRYRAASNGDDDAKDDPATGGVNDNKQVFSIIVTQGMNERLTPKGVEGVHKLVRQLLAIRPELVIVGHDDLEWTGCPGVDMQRGIIDKIFYPPEIEEAMQINSIVVRFAPAADQFICLPITKDEKERLGLIGITPLVVVSDLTLSQLSERLGYQLTRQD